MEILIPIVVVVALAFATLGAWIASQKNRDGGEGFILGLLFGPVGVIIEAVLPTLASPRRRRWQENSRRRNRTGFRSNGAASGAGGGEAVGRGPRAGGMAKSPD